MNETQSTPNIQKYTVINLLTPTILTFSFTQAHTHTELCTISGLSIDIVIVPVYVTLMLMH